MLRQPSQRKLYKSGDMSYGYVVADQSPFFILEHRKPLYGVCGWSGV